MARNGYRIFDSDTHVGPYMDVLERYLSSAEKAKLADWEPHRAKSKGFPVYTKGQRRYLRKLGTAQAEPDQGGYMAGFTGAKREREPSALGDHDPAERIKDLDYEGVDVNLTLPSGWFGTWTAGDDVALEMAMYRAYHRWMADYCGAFPERLGGVILAAARDVEGSLAEMLHWGKASWAWGLLVHAPVGTPLDHPAETIKAALPELRHRPTDYVTSGRYLQSIEIPEGAPLTNAVADLLGDDVLMYASDYPHGESHFPKSTGIVLGWEMPETRRRKLLWDNACRLYTRSGLN